MADSKITALTSISTSTDPANDPLVIVDVSDTSMAATGTTKKVTLNQLLGASGTATLASATITGDLTVDTSTLKVDSANDNVGIGTTTPASYAFNDPAKLVIANTGTAGAGNTFTIASGSTGFGQIAFANGTSGTSRYNGYIKYSHSTNAMEFYANAGALQATLNSTGLGVGGSPVNPLTVFAAASAKAPALLLSTAGSPTYGWDFSVDGAVNGNLFIRRLVAGTKTDVLEFDRSNGNVGIGVTPSAWSTLVPALQLGGGGTFLAARSTNPEMYIGTNAHYNGANWIYKTSAAASNYSQDTGAHRWYTAPSGTAGNAITFTQAMTLDATGNLGIGVTPSAWSATFRSLDIGSGALTSQPSQQSIGIYANAFENGTNYTRKALGFAAGYSIYNGAHYWLNAASGAAGSTFAFGSAVMTLDASGNLFVGKTATGLGTVGIQESPSGWIQATVSGDASIFTNRLASDGKTIQLYRQTLEVGNISVTTTGATFNSTSDYRLKEAVAPLSGGLARVNALKPSVYKWKSNGLSGEGFLAHELAEVVPAAVNGEKDDVNEDGSIKAQSIDMSRVVPILVAAIQELAAEVNALKNA